MMHFKIQSVRYRAVAPTSSRGGFVLASLASGLTLRVQVYITQSVDKVVLQQSIPRQIRQVILYISFDEDEFDNF